MNKVSNWNTEYNTTGPGSMVFSLNNNPMLSSNGVELGMLKEIHGIENICRTHTSDKTEWDWIETETFHPFGSEPVIKHKWEQAGNHIRVVTDIIIRGKTPLDFISIDSLKLSGNWESVKIISQIEPNSTELRIEEFDISSIKENNLDLPHYPLVLLFKSIDGTDLEIGAGYDLWRWNINNRFDAHTQFSLHFINEELIFERKVLKWDEEYLMPRNNFRFSWYFAWGESTDSSSDNINDLNTLLFKDQKLLSDNSTSTSSFKFDNNSWPQSVIIENNDLIFPCFCSRQTNNLLKKWLRSTIAQMLTKKEKDIHLYNVDSNLCTKNAHIIGQKNKKIIHWDIPYMLGLWEWANKYLSEYDSTISIHFSKDNIFSELPSVKGMNSEQ